jgi:hypothetical protein
LRPRFGHPVAKTCRLAGERKSDAHPCNTRESGIFFGSLTVDTHVYRGGESKFRPMEARQNTAETIAGSRIEHNATKRRPTNYYSRLTSKPQRPAVSQRSALGKRLRDLADAFAERLGGWPALSVTTAAAVRKAAELVALSEQMRRDALRNGCTDPDGLLRFEGITSRAVRQLGLRVEPPPARARGLEIARERWAAAEAKAEKAKTAGEASATPTTEPPDGRA